MAAIMKKHILLAAAGAAVLALAGVATQQWLTLRELRQELRQMFFSAIRPVRLSNCTLERFGSPHDGGYLLCANLLGQIESAYSYGISGDDNWGCDVSKRYHVPVHQYDCFFHGAILAGRRRLKGIPRASFAEPAWLFPRSRQVP